MTGGTDFGVPAEHAPEAPHCAWHPERETWIKCTRCQRPICPECLTPAPVGFHCPEEVRAVTPTRRPRTTFGGKATAIPVVTYALVLMCAIAYVFIGMLNLLGGLEAWGMWPLAVAGGNQFYRLLTAIFLHGSVLHIIFNMYVLASFGPPLEHALGRMRFLALYVIAGLGGSVASFMYSPLNTLSVGASGAIFGLLTATIVVGLKLRQDVRQIVALLAVNVLLGFAISNVDWRAHFGGAVVGAATAFILAIRAETARDRQRRLVIQVLGCAGIVAVLIVLAIHRNEQIDALIRAGGSVLGVA